MFYRDCFLSIQSFSSALNAHNIPVFALFLKKVAVFLLYIGSGWFVVGLCTATITMHRADHKLQTGKRS